MRISAETKRRTRERLLAVAHRLLVRKGLQGVTTRDVAFEAGLAHGTLFNYFPTKEALALCLCRQLLAEAEAEQSARRHDEQTLEEALFAHVVAGLRRLAPFRPWAGELLGTIFRPTAGRAPVAGTGTLAEPPRAGPHDGPHAGPHDGRGEGHGDPAPSAIDDDPYALQARHLEVVREIITRYRGADAAGPVALHLYWSLYLGVLAWWSADGSPHQEDTLAVLDRSLHMFTAALGAPPAATAEARRRRARPARARVSRKSSRAASSLIRRRKEMRHEP